MSIVSRPPSPEYKDGWDRIYGKSRGRVAERFSVFGDNPDPEFLKSLEKAHSTHMTAAELLGPTKERQPDIETLVDWDRRLQETGRS